MVQRRWSKRKDLIGHSGGGGGQKKRAAGRGRGALQEMPGKRGSGLGRGGQRWVRDGGRRGRLRLATTVVAVAVVARRIGRLGEEEVHFGKRQGCEGAVQAEKDGHGSGIVYGEEGSG